MIRIKPEQDVTKRKAGVFRFYHLFQSSVFHIILSVHSLCGGSTFLLFYLTNYKRAVIFCIVCVFHFLCGVYSNKIIQNVEP